MEKFIEVSRFTKRFPGVLALDNVSIDLQKGQIHGLLGENGAGKSTLIKCLTGIFMPDDGTMKFQGKEVIFDNPRKAIDMGISCIYQELNTIPELSVTDNIFIGQHKKNSIGLLDYEDMHIQAKDLLQRLGQNMNPKTKMKDLGVGQQQMVEIAKAISRNAKLLIMDEPTASLSRREIDELLKVVKYLAKQDVAILFISHKLEEVFEICDVVTILRDGKKIVTEKVENMTYDSLISNMVGRTLNDLIPKVCCEIGEEVLRVEKLTRYGVYKNISFAVRKGEVLGISGLVGAGRTEVLRGVFGIDAIDSGDIFYKGKKVEIGSPLEAIKRGIAFVTENRKEEGLVLNDTVINNLIIVSLKKYSNALFLQLSKIKEATKKNIKELQIKVSSGSVSVGTLSGGNQQKVVIGKWLNTDAEVYIFDEPTRGIDIGAKIEVYNIINSLTRRGKAIIMISSELPEILGMSDKVIILREGELMGEIERGSYIFNEETIMKAAWGGRINA